MVRQLVVMSLSAVVGVCVFADSDVAAKPNAANWVCAGYFEKRLDRQEASITIQKYRERFLARRDGAVDRAMFVFPAAYEVVRKHLRSVAGARFGEKAFAAHAELDVGSAVAPSASAAVEKSAPVAARERLVTALEQDGVRLGRVAAISIKTEKYNSVPSKDGWSELDILAFDGAPVLGTASTLIVMSRRDSAKEWGLRSANPFSFGRHATEAAFVTSTEFALMRRLAEIYDIPFAVVPLGDGRPLYREKESLISARDWLRRYSEMPDEVKAAKDPGRC